MLTLSLVALVTLASSLVLIDIMDEVTFSSLVKRGSAIARSAATPAAYSILADDRLALDNLAVRLKESQDDLVYVAILDQKGTILAHDRVGRVGSSLRAPSGPALEGGENFSLYRVRREGQETFEVRAPVTFADKAIGHVVVGIDTKTLAAA
ncbi:MAG: hypothetical protein GWO11_01170, partial [Desulfuromonadales bacterium]|nr:hypothetical protein [Desulfuromonadales bacterium]NIR33114.1 hypothetical protein [Desulfuromonadales bacterium]NIS40602.1 hypothetical protein [Desulfuromonadales bacterium]